MPGKNMCHLYLPANFVNNRDPKTEDYNIVNPVSFVPLSECGRILFSRLGIANVVVKPNCQDDLKKDSR